MTTTEFGASFRPVLEHDDGGLNGWGMVIRQVHQHRVEPLPGRPISTCRWEGSSRNTMLGMHLAELPGGQGKCDHRHLDETLSYMVSGRGFTELRQADEAEPVRFDWQAGDLVVIPTNAWHRHVNLDEERPARQFSFRNTALIERLLQGHAGRYDIRNKVYNDQARFFDRFADERDFFQVREQVAPGRVRTHAVTGLADEPLPPEDDELGKGVALQYYDMGGQRTLEVALVGVRAGGSVRPHRPLAEECLFVLRGEGRTEVWQRDGELHSVEWRAGDALSPPLGVWRQHVVSGGADVRLLRVRNVALQRALGIGDGLDPGLPDRFLHDGGADG